MFRVRMGARVDESQVRIMFRVRMRVRVDESGFELVWVWAWIRITVLQIRVCHIWL